MSLLLGSAQRTGAVIGCQELELPFRQEIMPTEAPSTVDSGIEDIGYRRKSAKGNCTLGQTKPCCASSQLRAKGPRGDNQS